MKLLSKLLKALVPKEWIYNAIEWKSKRYLNLLIESGADVNAFYINRPFLGYALLKKVNEIAFILLENKADPNAAYTNEYGESRKLIEDCLDWADINQVSLLIYYGAEIKNISQYPKLVVAQKIYQNDIAPLQSQKSADVYKQLSEVWLKVAELEEDSELKRCYRQKSNNYYNNYLDYLKNTKEIVLSNISDETETFIPPSNETTLRNRYTKF